MKPEDAEEYTQSLGQIVGGSWRQIQLAKRLGVPDALGLTIEDWVNSRLGGYARMSIDDRRPAVEELKALGHSNREIAQILGVSHQTVGRDGPNGPPNARTSTKPADYAIDGGPNGPPNGSDAKASKALEHQRRQEAEEENKRETFVRLCEATYRGTLALSVKEFVADIRSRLNDKEFIQLFMTRLRIDETEIPNIQSGAKALADLLSQLVRRGEDRV